MKIPIFFFFLIPFDSIISNKIYYQTTNSFPTYKIRTDKIICRLDLPNFHCMQLQIHNQG
jgi:hypothetical protein